MPAPFYNCIKGTTAGTPGTGAFTPNAASSGFLAWSTVPTGWIGLVRYEDGSAWELQYSYWNGTTLSRASTQFVASSTGSALTLTSAATAALIVDATDVMSHLGETAWRGWFAITERLRLRQSDCRAVTATATVSAAGTIATTNYLTEQSDSKTTSATTANAQAGWRATVTPMVVSTSAGRGGFEMVCRFGASTLPTGPRLFVGATSVTMVANTGEPSALTASLAAFAKDSTDTNIQLLVNSNAGSGTKTDTGIALVANGWYSASVWCEPGSNTVYGIADPPRHRRDLVWLDLD
jgi:hypothetical protein